MKNKKLSAATFVRKGLLYYRRTNLSVLAGVILCTTVLVGALVTGDSVRFTLNKITHARLGNTGYALSAGDRFFSTELAAKLADTLDVAVAPIIQVSGIAVYQETRRRVNQLQVLGVDSTFWHLGGVADPFNGLDNDEIAVNTALANRLAVKPGDEILVRFNNPGSIPVDMPFSVQDNLNIAIRKKIAVVLNDRRFGRFSLKTSQTKPFNIFLPARVLSEHLNQDQRANIILVEDGAVTEPALARALQNHFSLRDAGLFWRKNSGGRIELLSERIFIDPPVVDAIEKSGVPYHTILTYFANEITTGEQSSPFLFVSTGKENSRFSAAENEIIINNWLARDLDADIGDYVQLRYWVVGSTDKLQRAARRFRIAEIVPMPWWDAGEALVPHIPGLTDAGSCRDWEPGLPVELDKIRPKDEQYWDQYGAAPKALVHPAAAKEMWANRFGAVTAVRFSAAEGAPKDMARKISRHLLPVSLGFVFTPVMEQGLHASRESVDFGQLFLGLSFFIIVAAALLTGLLFAFGLDNRTSQTGLFLAVGLPRKYVARLLVLEGIVLSVTGGVLGCFLGVVYNKIVLHALGTVWRGAVGTSSFYLYVNPVSLLLGFCTSVFISVLTLFWVVRRQVKSPISQTQRGYFAAFHRAGRRAAKLTKILLAAVCLGILFILLTTSPQKGMQVAGRFFGLGFLYLAAVLLAANFYFIKTGGKHKKLGTRTIGIRNNARHRPKSLTTIGLLACGIFVTIAVGANRSSPLKNAHLRASGTGGFSLYAETVVPLPYLPDSDNGRKITGLTDSLYNSVSFVPFRVRDGDDASCLNLNRITKPRILGVRPKDLSQRGAFTFVKTTSEVDPGDPWAVLNQDLGPNVVPGVADMTVITWGFGKAVGDTLQFTDASGRPLYIKLVGGLANSVFQGNVIIGNNHFIRHFNAGGGYRLFLIDAGRQPANELLNTLSWNLQDYGLDITTALEKLASFSIVTNTYLNIFLALGGLGLMVGTLGLGIMVARNMTERRSEIALLRAVGWPGRMIFRTLFTEFGVLLLAGLFAGVIAGVLAVLPALFLPGTKIPYIFIGTIIVFILLNGLFWIYMAIKFSMRGELLSALRQE